MQDMSEKLEVRIQAKLAGHRLAVGDSTERIFADFAFKEVCFALHRDEGHPVDDTSF